MAKCDLRWNLMSRNELSMVYLPIIAHKTEHKFTLFLQSLGEASLSIEFDHWMDICHRSILAIVATTKDGKRYLIKLEDVSLKGKTTQAIVETLHEGLHLIPPRTINAIMSDSASACKAAREQLVNEKNSPYASVIQYRCIAHFVNSIGNHITSEESLTDLFIWANRLVTFINSRSKIAAKLSKSGLQRLSKATSVRWYSNVDMLESLLKVKDEIKILLEEEAVKDSEETRILLDDLFWDDCAKILKILRPLVNCIGVAERSDGSLGESVAALLEFAKSLFDSDWSDDYVTVTMRAFLNYFNINKLGEEEFGLMLTSYCLDKRNKLNYLTDQALELVFKTLAQLALKSGVRKQTIQGLLIDEYEKYKYGSGLFGKQTEEEQSAAEWWRSLPDLGLLRNLALRISNLKSSSANIERVFSILKFIQSPARTRFSIETLESIARAKLSMVDAADLELFSMLTEEERIFDDENSFTSSRSASSSSIRPAKRGVRLSRLAKKIAKLPTKIFGLRRSDSASRASASQSDRFKDDAVRENYRSFSIFIDFNIIQRRVNQEECDSTDEDTSSAFDSILRSYQERNRN